eukprot:3489085-Prymnesium_polylepis.1
MARRAVCQRAARTRCVRRFPVSCVNSCFRQEERHPMDQLIVFCAVTARLFLVRASVPGGTTCGLEISEPRSAQNGSQYQ